MPAILSWEEVVARYPNEWVAFTDYELVGPRAVQGTIIAHENNKKSLYQFLSQTVPPGGNVAVRYTGQLIKEDALPMLWVNSTIS